MAGFLESLTNFAGNSGFGNALNVIGPYLANQGIVKDLKQSGTSLRAGAEQGAQQVLNAGTFKPFTVTTGLSNTSVNADGGYNIGLNPQQQFYQDELFGTAAGMLQGATQDQGTREQQVFDRLQAMLNPVQGRERLELENRLQGQGRLGVRTSMYGGTPEQLALAKAQAEAQNMAGFQAMQEARAQQAQGADIGMNLFQLGYLPTQQAMASLTPATNFADISGANRRQAMQAATALQQGGLEADVAMRSAAGQVEQRMFDTILNALTQQNTNAAGVATGNSLIDRIIAAGLNRVGG